MKNENEFECNLGQYQPHKNTLKYLSCFLSPNDNPPTDQHEIVPDALVPKAGRPVGTTNEKKREDAEKYKRCVTSIAHAYSTKVTVSKASTTICPR